MTGCVLPSDAAPHPAPTDRPVVVAILEAGLNPYHAFFRSAEGDGRAFADLPSLKFSHEGSYAERHERDAGLWKSVKPGILYRLVETHLLAIDFVPPDYQTSPIDGKAQTPVASGDAHGTAVAAAVLQANPDAFVLLVQVPTTYNFASPDGSAHPFIRQALLDGLHWAANSPLVDIISVSAGIAQGATGPEGREVAMDYRFAAGHGKMIVAAAGNTPNVGWAGVFQGQPESIIVGGADPENESVVATSAQYSDVVANFSIRYPREDSTNGTRSSFGTSFSAPAVAGTLSRALELSRKSGLERGGAGPTPRDFRSALNATATVWNTSRPTPPSANLLDAPYLSTPVTPAWWTQVGWGYVGPDYGERIFDALKNSPTWPVPVPAEKQAGEPFMRAQYEARAAFWAKWAGNASGS